MTAPNKRPSLALVREGNPGHRTRERLEQGLRLPPARPDEPDWRQWFPVTSPKGDRRAQDNQRGRKRAAATWARVVPVLDAQGLLASVDFDVLVELCLVVAQLELANRSIAVDGIWAQGERGAVKNPATTFAGQLRTALKFYVVQLGLSPLARDAFGIIGGPSDGEDDGDGTFDV